MQVSEQDIKHAVNSFPPGSAGGTDGLHPQHIADLVSCRDNGSSLLTVITAFVNILLKSQCAPEVIPFLFGANLTALTKKSGGIRSIAVGYYWRRLLDKYVNSCATDNLATYFSPIQLGIGVPGGCEAAIHESTRFLLDMPDDFIVVKLDFSNAFNCLHRLYMLESINSLFPKFFIFVYYHIAMIVRLNSNVDKFSPRKAFSNASR